VCFVDFTNVKSIPKSSRRSERYCLVSLSFTKPSPAVSQRRLSRIAKGCAPSARYSKLALARIAKGDGFIWADYTMHLVELFVPKTAASKEGISSLQNILVKQFGGVTAYSRAPAKGIDTEDGQKVEDEIIILEVMTDSLDRAWWSSLRSRLERDLQQREILIRASEVQLL